MHRLLVFSLLFLLVSPLWSQESQTVRLAPGGTVTLIAHSENALSYVWHRDGEPILHQYDSTLLVSQAGTYTVVALGANCDSDLSDPVEVIIDDQGPPERTVDMQIQNQPDKPVVMRGQPISYQVIARNKSENTAIQVEVVIQLPSEVVFDQIAGTYLGEASYNPSRHEIRWFIPVVESGQTMTMNILVHADRTGIAQSLATISATQTDRNTADNQHTSIVEIISLKIPNVFTPNGDGYNDTFEIVGLELLRNADLSIFNPDGLEVYRNTNYQNNWAGEGLGSGVYFYILKIDFPQGEQEIIKGHVTILQ